eukprot:SAG22_NODE_719_length_7666_cov_5.819083_2_plen_137_part_00
MFGGNGREGGDPTERNACEVFLGGTPATASAAYRAASPAALLPLGVPQLLVNGENDLDVPLATVLAYAARARLAGDVVEELVFSSAELAPVPDHFAVITPTLGAGPDGATAGNWARQIAAVDALLAKVGGRGAAKL